MLSSKYILTIIFRLINFGALIALSVYLFKRYALPSFKLKIHEKQARLDDLNAQHTLLARDDRLLERALIDDRKHQEYLTQRVMAWKAKIARDRERFIQERQKRSELLQKRTALQDEYVQKNRLRELILPAALEQARGQLISQYNEPRAQKEFINRVITTLRSEQ